MLGVKKPTYIYHRQARRLVKAIRLISGFSSLPVDEEKAEESTKLIRLFFREMVKEYDDLYATYTHHNFLHVVQDLLRFQCHLDRNSSYDFETYHQQYKRLFKPGPKQHIQIKYVFFEWIMKENRIKSYYQFKLINFQFHRNSLVLKRIYRCPIGPDGSLSLTNMTPEDVEDIISSCAHESTNQRRPNAPKQRIRTAKSTKADRGEFKELQCWGFTLRNYFPQNVVKCKSGRILVCKDMVYANDNKNVVLICNRFKTVRNAFPNAVVQCGIHFASEFCTTTLEKVELKDIRMKCVIFPYGVRDELKKEDVVGKILLPDECDSWFVSEMIE